MSIFTKQIKDLGFSDIEDLLKEKACENIRLEFKSQAPSKEEMIKKLSSFANTYGGYLIVGVEDDGKGCIKAIPGISPKSRYDQTIVQWCFEEVYPPLQPIISSPISHRDTPKKVFYVIYVEESMEAPHFLTKRRGAYIRTDEYSQKFEARLAKWEELQFIANRRRKAEEKREFQLDRAHKRFQIYRIAHIHSTTHKPLSHLKQAILPLFPTQQYLEYGMLKIKTINSAFSVRDDWFPPKDNIYTQHESIISELEGRYFEANVYGLLYYALPVSCLVQDEPQPIIHMQKVVAWIIAYLKYAAKFYQSIGFDGILKMQLKIDKLLDKKIWFPFTSYNNKTVSFLDNEVMLNRIVEARELVQLIPDVSKGLFRELGYCCGWKGAFEAKEEFMDEVIEEGLKYLWVDKSFLEKL